MGQRLAPFAIAAAVFLLDRASKWIIKTHLSLWDTLTLIPGSINIVHTENPGIAFGLLANSPSAWRDVLLIGFSIAVLAGISTILVRANRSVHSHFLRTGLALVMGGALGNLYDRTLNGTVTDFFEVHAGQSYFFPAFNVADSAITTGACLLLLDMWRSRERKSEPAGVPPTL